MKVFIENEAGKNQKNLFDEKTLKYVETIEVARKYPFPYGFILDTTAEDGDNVDVFILTEKVLEKGQIYDCEPIGLMEQFERSWDNSKNDVEEVDHNVLAVLESDGKSEITEEVKKQLTEFVTHVFDNIQKNKTRVGDFLGEEQALRYIESRKDN